MINVRYMNKYSLKKPGLLSSLAIFLVISISVSHNNLSYAFLVLDYGGTDNSADSTVDRTITSSQSSHQGSYCYAPPNATIINSCNSGDLSSQKNTGLNSYE